MRIAAVIPAYNEAPRLPRVLAAVRAAAGVEEVIVVSDGSTDETYAVAAAWPGVTAVSLPTNAGKAGALAAGVDCTHAAGLLFLDADLIGLTPAHIEALLQPLSSEAADMTVGRFRAARYETDWSHLVAPNVSGQRALRRELFTEIPQVATLRFGIEAALTHQARLSRARVQIVELAGVTHALKAEKYGWRRALQGGWRMRVEIFRYAAWHKWRGTPRRAALLTSDP
jgi:glycosyltransferase involved in cell wall biosynthesis